MRTGPHDATPLGGHHGLVLLCLPLLLLWPCFSHDETKQLASAQEVQAQVQAYEIVFCRTKALQLMTEISSLSPRGWWRPAQMRILSPYKRLLTLANYCTLRENFTFTCIAMV